MVAEQQSGFEFEIDDRSYPGQSSRCLSSTSANIDVNLWLLSYRFFWSCRFYLLVDRGVPLITISWLDPKMCDSRRELSSGRLSEPEAANFQGISHCKRLDPVVCLAP
jgi:hypothetical protein